ncbi:Hypothetical protein, putative, partial [Bodo saltans]
PLDSSPLKSPTRVRLWSIAQHSRAVHDSIASGSTLRRLQRNTIVPGWTFFKGFLHRHQPAASSPTCCIVTNLLHRHQPVSVAEGFLSFGASDNVSSFLEPFGKGSSVCVGSMSPSNATLGVSPTSPGPYQGMWIPLLVAKEQRAFRVITDGAAPNSTVVSCNGTPLIVILKSVPKYVFRPQGENYTAPNTTEYQVASLAHVMSTEFMDYYNNQTGLLLTGTTTNIGYCCVVKVAEGWLFNRGDAW